MFHTGTRRQSLPAAIGTVEALFLQSSARSELAVAVMGTAPSVGCC